MSPVLNKYITVDPQILGGTPVVSGTRIPVERIEALVKEGYTTESLKEEYPQLDVKKIQFLIAYLMQAGLDAFKQYQKQE